MYTKDVYSNNKLMKSLKLVINHLKRKILGIVQLQFLDTQT